VGGRYEVQIRSPLKSAATGDLVEMMLIQIQFIKRDLLSAMKAMDEILRENRFNLQVGACVAVVAWAARRNPLGRAASAGQSHPLYGTISSHCMMGHDECITVGSVGYSPSCPNAISLMHHSSLCTYVL
jgi:hypothetical protein